MDFWSKYEYRLRDHIPDCLIRLLKQGGYDNMFSIKLLNHELIDQLEVFANERSPGTNFKILPGHRAALLALPKLVEQCEKNIDESNAMSQNRIQSYEHTVVDNKFSFIFSKLIETAQNNINKAPNHRRYSDEIHSFAMYLYIMGGKAAYEVLSKNIPLPQTSTIREFKYFTTIF